ncbi:butyrophilin subfamily 2 member A2-like [Grus japonensis]|uniref:Butyrophilin subfamily 2 member A2-like n=1 Tax=Grus japonensis TaxID=30415 RepID=A0ABC9Y058_GRUJA
MTMEENTTRALESMQKKDFQQVSQQIQTLQRALETMQRSTQRDLQMLRVDLENQLARTVEAHTTTTLESMWEKDLWHVSQQIQNLRKVLQSMQLCTYDDLRILRADLENQLETTVEANTTRALASMREKDLQQISQQIQTLQTALQNMQLNTHHDLEILRADLENQLGRTVEATTTRALESMRENELQKVSQQIQTLQKALQNMQDSTQSDLEILRADLDNKLRRTVEANTTRALEFMWEKDLKQMSQQIKTLQTDLQNMQESKQHDLEILRTNLESQLRRTVEANTTRALEYMREKDLQEVFQQIQTLQKAFETMQESTQHGPHILRADLESRLTKQGATTKKSLSDDHLADLENTLGRTVEANTTRALEFMWEKDLQQMSQQIKTLQTDLQNMQESKQHDLEILRTNLESQLRRTVEANTTRALEYMREKDLQEVFQQIQTLQKAFETMQESTQHGPHILRADLESRLTKQGATTKKSLSDDHLADLENTLGGTVEANTTRALESMWEKDLQEVSKQIQTLQKAFETMQESTQHDLQILRADLENQLGGTVEANTTRVLESMREKDLQEISQQIQTLQKAFETMQESTQHGPHILRADLDGRLTKQGHTAKRSLCEDDLSDQEEQSSNKPQSQDHAEASQFVNFSRHRGIRVTGVSDDSVL